MGVKSIAKTSALTLLFAEMGTGLAGSPASAETKTDKDDTSKRICKIITPTGSRMTTRICRTQAEWDRSQSKTAEGVLRHQTNESTGYER